MVETDEDRWSAEAAGQRELDQQDRPPVEALQAMAAEAYHDSLMAAWAEIGGRP